MKNIISLLTISVILITLSFSGCKKGENDPFISLKSRTSRLAQDWKLTSGTVTETDTYNGSTDVDTYTYTDATETHTSGGNSTTHAYSMELSIDKKGTYKTTTIDDGDVNTEEGSWMWTRKVKNQDLKNKEAIYLRETSYTYGSNSYSYSGKSNDVDNIWVIDKLSSKELVILYDYKETDSDGEIYTVKGTMTFTKK